ncbi:hypothetical protein LXL04_033699 [Taraxacum kok-saghyz]
MFGDFSEVREENERYGSVFSEHGEGLVEVQLDARKYTWMNKMGTKMSKSHRFLVSTSVLHYFPRLAAMILERRWSDHNPILLHDLKVDYGATPFRVFHS